MDNDLWLAAPCAAIKIWNGESGLQWRANPAALEWGRSVELHDSDWRAVAERLAAAQAPDAGGEGTLTTPPLRWNSVRGAGAWVVWLQPDAAPGAEPWRSTADKLELVQRFGRLGLWERNLRTGEGRWDAHTFRLFGFEPGEVVSDFEVAATRIHPDDRDRVRREYQGFLQQPGRHASRYRLSLPDGSLRHVQALLEVRAGADGRAQSVIGGMVDDTEGVARVLAQEAVSAKFEKALNLAKVSVWHIDAALDRIVFNDVGYELTGLDRTHAGIELERVRATVHPDDLDAIVRAADEAMHRPGVVDVEARYRNPDGSYRHLLTRRVAERDANGSVIGLMGISLDQTAQIAERERAHALARRIELVTEAARVGVWSVDTAHDTVEWNAEMLRIYGLAPDAPVPSLKQWIGELVHPDDRRELVSQRRRAAEQGRLDFEAEFRIVRPGGEVRWVACRSRRELRERGELVAGIHLDLTEQTLQRQHAEQALRDRESAQRANIAKSEFLARISHELRTPLNAVLGFAQLLEHDEAANRLPPQQLERVAHIRSAGEHLMALIGDVLDLSAIEAGNLTVAREPVSVDTVLGDVASWLAPLAAGGRVVVRVERSDAWVLADAQRLRQILVNLASDAVKYARAGGTVWLAAHSGEQAGVAGWFICVRDDGRGLTATEREHLADSFTRLEIERETKEPAIGLTIVRRLAEFMGGRVDVAGTNGSGSEFRIWLPACAAPQAAPMEQDDAKGSPAPRLSIVYIEDNPVNVILVKELVAMRPEVALVCSVDGVSGVERALDDRPDVVLVDMQLPDIDGYEVLKRLRAQPSMKESSIIALSANGMSDDIGRAKAAGFDDYWTKPIDFRRFLAGLDALVAVKAGAPH
jgi:PAS domain S-box-containing protein